MVWPIFDYIRTFLLFKWIILNPFIVLSYINVLRFVAFISFHFISFRWISVCLDFVVALKKKRKKNEKKDCCNISEEGDRWALINWELDSDIIQFMKFTTNKQLNLLETGIISLVLFLEFILNRLLLLLFSVSLSFIWFWFWILDYYMALIVLISDRRWWTTN